MPDWVIGGHDKRRATGRIGQAQARILAMLLLTLKGTPFFFAGDELGMTPVPVPSERKCDPLGKLVPGYGLDRDPERTPMQWDASRNAGFTSGEPWLPLGPDFTERNVMRLKEDRYSILWLYRDLIALRRREPALNEGEYKPLRSRNDILAHKRIHGDDELLIALNVANEPRRLEWTGEGTLMISTHLDREARRIAGPLLLRPAEGIIVRLDT